MNYNDPLSVAIELAQAAGATIMRHYEHLIDSELAFKGERDLLTRADQEAEQLIVAGLRQAFPNDSILAEESGESGAAGRPRWIVDPLDGTTNFVHALPIFAVSIARVDAAGEPQVGVVYLPRLNELFAARRGGGATLNGDPIRVSSRAEPMHAVLATGFHYQRQLLTESNVDHFAKFILGVRGVRRMGAASVDLAYVAAGRLDGYWEAHLSPWDVAAGALLVEEAGGRVCDMRGGDQWLYGRSILASNGSALHNHMLRTIARSIPGWREIQRRIGGA
jgi:myo-inositol-1(or 4)-monophosphatase